MKDEKDIFQNLDGFEVAPSAQAWGKLEKRLGPEKQRKAVVLWRVAAAIALLLMGSGALYLGTKQQTGPDQTVAQATKPASRPQVQPLEAAKPAKASQRGQEGNVAGNGTAEVQPVEGIAKASPAESTSSRKDAVKKAIRMPAPEETSTQMVAAHNQKDNRPETKQNQPAILTAYEQQIAEVQKNQPSQEPVAPQVAPTPEDQAPVVAMAETPIAPRHLEPVSFTMELKPTREQADEAEEDSDRPLLAKLVKSADDVASGRVKGRDLLNRGQMALNSFLNRGRRSADPETDKN